ncbi:DNA-binding protein [Virgibacillus dokdonensis]|uniref:DNA-binding protein n=1 Tax=Virgibacillus dokdonensis TaxID=302167 RepID=A0ABU7VHG7_9BACI
MPVTTFSEEEIQSFVSEIKKQLVPVLIKELEQKQLPPLLTRKQFMELVDIGSTKCNELFNREGFPVTREFGHPRVITKLFFDWVNESANQSEVSLRYPYQII